MAVSAILNFGQFFTFDHNDIEGRVIPLSKVFPIWGVHFRSYILDARSVEGVIIIFKKRKVFWSGTTILVNLRWLL